MRGYGHPNPSSKRAQEGSSGLGFRGFSTSTAIVGDLAGGGSKVGLGESISLQVPEVRLPGVPRPVFSTVRAL